jgi:exonuclease SbcC
MRFERIKLRGMATFKGDVDIDLTKIEGQLIALTGRNGEGKSTLLELLPGALFRQCATRGSLQDNALARDSFVEVTVCNGQRYTVRQLVDGISGKSECAILNEAGEPLIASAKVREADAWVAAHFPPASVLYTSSIAVQERRGLLDLKESERKAVVLRALGIERLETMAQSARERAKAAQAEVDLTRARLRDLPEVDLTVLRCDVAIAASQAGLAELAAKEARRALERAKAASSDAAKAYELAEQRKAAAARLAAAETALADIERRLANNRQLLGEADAVRAAEASAKQLDGMLEAARAKVADADVAHREVNLAVHQAGAATERCLRDLAKVREQSAGVERRLKDASAIRAAESRVGMLKTALHNVEEAVVKLEQSKARDQSLLVSAQGVRIAGLRSALDDISMGDSDPVGVAEGALVNDTRLERDQLAAPVRIAEAQTAIESEQRAAARLRGDLSQAERLAARAGDIAQAEAEQASLDAERLVLEAKHAELQAYEQAERTSQAVSANAANAARATVTALEGEREALKPLLAKVKPLEQAEARVEELTASYGPANATVQSARVELGLLPEADFQGMPDTRDLDRAVQAAEGAEHTAREALGRARDDVERGARTAHQRERLEGELVGLEATLADWTRLAQDLGRDGLQAMEIDACLPEVNAIANDLLHSCSGPRYTVELRTDRLSADGKRTLEGLPIRVIDTQHGRDSDVEALSPGQRSIIGEAIALAFTTLACRRAGTQGCTLVRDEAAAAIDAEGSAAYVAMLRRAAKQIGADKILLVSHVPEVQALCDARIHVENGTARVVS